MSDDVDLDDLKAQTSQGDRIEMEAEREDQRQLTDAILDELEAIDDGEQQKTVSVWDGQLAAFIRALEKNPDDLRAVGHGLQRRLGVEESDVDRSEVLRLALRIGFQEAAPDQFDALRDAVREQATSGL